jgi:putative hydroxymethylpyrimidine transport system substrate-binding protein
MTRSPLQGFIWLLGFLAAAVLLVGCGEDQGTAETVRKTPTAAQGEAHSEELRMTLEGSESAENVGVLMAAERGYFDDAGLDIWVGSPLEPSRAAAYVAKGIDDLGVTELPQVVIGKEKNMPIVAVGGLVSHPTGAMIWLRSSGIDRVADLRGKTIAVPGVPFQAGFLEAVLAGAGLALDDVKLKRVGYELVPALVDGQADAIFGGSSNIEGAELEALGEKPVVTPARDLGIPDYEELVLIARTDLVAENPQLIRDFVSAVDRGTAAAISHPETALKVIRKALEAVPPPDRRMMEAQVRATLPLLSRSRYMSPKRAQRLIDWMYENKMVQRRWSAEDVLTNAFAEP